MEEPSNKNSSIKLLGNLHQSFYDLGIKDKFSYQRHHEDTYFQDLIPKLVGFSQYFKKAFSYSTPYLKDYSQGVSQSIETVMLHNARWDLFSSLPHLKSYELMRFGNTTEFSLNQIERKLLTAPQNQSLRVLSFSPDNFPHISYINFQKEALPLFFSKSEKGLLISAHRKNSSQFYFNARCMPDIIFELLLECRNISEAEKKLKKMTSQSAWSLYLIDKNQVLLECDIIGNQKKFHRYQLEQEKSIFFDDDYSSSSQKNLPIPFFGHLIKLGEKGYLELTSIAASQGAFHLHEAQKAYHDDEMPRCYHHLQMSIASLKEKKTQALLNFLFCILQYIYAQTNEEFLAIAHEFSKLSKDLPDYQNELRLLFELRINQITRLGSKLNGQLQNKKLQEVIEREGQWSPTRHKLQRKLIKLRFDTCDVYELV